MADDFVNTGDGENYYAETQLSVNQYSNYRISIPYSLQEGAVGNINLNDVNLEAGYSLKLYITNLNDDGTVPMYVTTSRGQTASSDMLVFFDDVQLTTSDGLMAEHDGMDFTDDCSSATHTIQYINTGVDLAGVYTGVISYRVEVSPSY